MLCALLLKLVERIENNENFSMGLRRPRKPLRKDRDRLGEIVGYPILDYTPALDGPQQLNLRLISFRLLMFC